MVDVASIISLSYALATIPSSVQVNQSQCQLLADRVVSLAAHLERMQGLDMQEKLEKGHEDVLLRAQSVVVDCRDFMQSFQDGLWMAKAIFREKHKDRFQELHESLSYVFQILHLEIDYHSLTKRSIQADAADVANMEERLTSVAASMEKLEQSVTTMTDESKRQHDDVMAALKNVRVYRQTLDQDQLSAALSTAREQESLDFRRDGGKNTTAPGEGKEYPHPLGTGTDMEKREAGLADGAPLGVSHGDIAVSAVPDPGVPTVPSETIMTIGRPPKAVVSQPQGSTNATNATKSDIKGSRVAAQAPVDKLSLGPPLRRKPFSQSYGVGLLEAGVTGGGWFDAPVSVVEPNVGEGGAKRGEYEVSFGEGPMGLSLKNVEARAEVSKVEAGGAAHAAGVRPGDNVVGVNGRIPLGYTQVMGTLPTAARPVRIRFIRGHGASWSPGGTVKRTHASTWASNAVTAGVHHPAGDRGVLLEIYAKASFSPTPWIRSEGWDELPISPTSACGGRLAEGHEGHTDKPTIAHKGSDHTPVPAKDGAGFGSDNVSDLSRWSGVRVGRAGKTPGRRPPYIIDGGVRTVIVGMSGVLPPSMGSLDELRTIELRENRLEGNIPESLRYLQKVTKVDLAHNLLEGSVPGGDARWINGMSILLLNNNKLSGHIPSTLGRLVNLTQLDLSFNNLSGGIPSELSKSPSLQVLSLAHNGITGSLPQSLGDLTRLKLLNISNNKLTGCLPQGWGRLTCLEELRLCHNALCGSIPDDILVIPSLVLVDLSANCLEDEIPTSLGTCSGNLAELDISRNSLSGEIHSNIGGVHKLKKLNLEKNTIGGPLPTSLANLKALEGLNLSNNLLSGPLLHIQWGNLSNLEHLHLANNKLGESLPSSLGALTSLVSLTLNANQLTGSIPRELHDLTGLKLLDLSGNKIAPSMLPRNSFFSERRTLKKKLSACDVRF